MVSGSEGAIKTDTQPVEADWIKNDDNKRSFPTLSLYLRKVAAPTKALTIYRELTLPVFRGLRGVGGVLRAVFATAERPS